MVDAAAAGRRLLPAGTKIQQWLLGGWTLVVFAFLYLPILLLIGFSFNESKLGIRWTDFTTHWYGVLLGDSVLLRAFQNGDVFFSRFDGEWCLGPSPDRGSPSWSAP